MLPLFLYPLAFLGLLAVPALLAIYLFRNRFRRQIVSSLMLWVDARESREGGRRLRRLQTPLLLLLELLAILLLVLAAADPYLSLRQSSQPLVVVLDDSLSMRAGEPSPRDRALAALREHLRAQPPYSVRLILAGERPQLLGDTARSPSDALVAAEGWTCLAPLARLDEAVVLGAELGGERARVLVLSDRAPAAALPETGRVQWWAFGRPLDNVAFVTAARQERDGRDRILLEIANLGNAPRTVTLTVEPLGGGDALRRSRLDLRGDETERIVAELPEGTSGLVARLDDGVLPLDSQVTLLPVPTRPVRIDVRMRDPRLREPMEKALRAVRFARLTATAPDLILRDSEGATEGEGAWVVRLIAENDATAYSGPFVFDRAHPLTEGLSLRSVIWGAGQSAALDGTPVLMAGNVVLIADGETPLSGGMSRHELRVRLTPELSTVQDSPDWPILVWNLLSWRGSALPGLARPNLRLGERTTLVLPTYRESVQLSSPGVPVRTVAVRGRQVTLMGDAIGIHETRDGEQSYRYAVNALNRDESDLRGCAEGHWGDWLDDATLHRDYRGVRWILLLGMLAVAVAHLLLMARGRRVGRPAAGG